MLSRRPFIGVLVGAICLSFPSPWSADQLAAPGKTYEVDTDHSRVFVKVGSATALGHPHGVEGRLQSGRLTPGGDGELVFDMGTFTADTGESRRRAGLEREKVSASDAKKTTDTMRGRQVLDAARFPTATFRINTITPLDRQPPGAPGTYQLSGRFTLHGSEKVLQIKAQLEPSPGPKGQMKLAGSFNCKQSDYGIKPYSTLGGLVKVSNELEITGDLLLIPQAN